jgi:hypothetical protein
VSKKTKCTNLLKEIETAVRSGNYIYTGHAQERLQQREVTRQEVKQVLKNGHHEKRKDHFDETYDEWNYSVKGNTVDKRKLRLIISFDENNLLVITVIDLEK